MTSTLLNQSNPVNVTQLTDQLRMAVRTGVLSPGQKLPTIRELADETNLTCNVVNRAFATLQGEGLLVSRKRAGTFVRESVGIINETEKRSRVRVFALICPELSHGYYPLLQRGFDFAAAQRGYQIITSNTNNDVRYQADTILQLIDKAVSGIALVPTTLGPAPTHHIRQLQHNKIPVVLLHRGVDGVQAPLIRIPAEAIGRLAGQKLVEAGHRRIAFCAGQRAGTAFGYERGLRSVLDEAEIELPTHRVIHGNMTLINRDHYSQYERQFGQWFDEQIARADRPTALFTSFTSVGEIAYFTALSRGLRIPDDLAIVTVGGRERVGVFGRRLACVTLDEEKVGESTAQLLDEMCREQRSITDDRTYPIDIDFDPGHMFGADD